jgi:4-hydroxy-3-methylbut-2-enyl diphosphate reductase
MTRRAYELKIVNTICPVTIHRQEDTVETAREVDFMVVVGGRHSANTRELTRLCEIVGTPVVQVEGAADVVDPAVFGEAVTVGITGGTSTPIEDLRAVAAKVLEIAGTPEVAARARALADSALEEAATPAGRTSSLPAMAG